MRRSLSHVEQPEAVRYAAQDAHIKHGQTVRADVSGVTVVPTSNRREPQVRFCQSDIDETTVQVLAEGDGLPIPDDTPVTLAGKVREFRQHQGYGVTLRGVLVTSNGELIFTIDRYTRIERTAALQYT